VEFYKDINDIERMAKYAMSLFDWSTIPLGHPVREHAYSYEHWGIVKTVGNIDDLYLLSKKEYQLEWAPTDQSLNQLIGIAAKNAGLSDTNRLMNDKIGEYSAEHLKYILETEETAVVIDIGTGAGGSILSLLRCAIDNGIDVSRLDITLIDPSGKRLEFSEGAINELLNERNITKGPRIRVIEGSVDVLSEGSVDVLREMDTDHAHLIIQCAAIHHESFNYHLSEIKRVLKPGMPFISGDWHEGSYATPARVYWIYNMLQDPLDEERVSQVLDFTLDKAPFKPLTESQPGLTEFRKLFSLDDNVLANAFSSYTESERRANVGGMRYWLEVDKILTKEGKSSAEVLIQAHERVAKRVELLKNAGFVFDSESRAKYVEVLRKKGFGELGAVMVPKKGMQRAQRSAPSSF
jgi:SAM-dependent methyltransferase